MLKVLELFAGIGSQTQALKNQNINHDVIGISEWSINSIISYAHIHTDNIDYNLSKEQMLKELSNYTFSMDTKKPIDIKRLDDNKLKLLYNSHINSKNLGSINDIKGKDITDCDLITYSFPCQDLSLQGKQKGLFDGKTSSLLWQVGRLLDEIENLPKFLLMENVPAILNDKNKFGFEQWKEFLTNKGYYNYVLKLKASDFNVPQNRERCFMISSLIELNGIENKILSNGKPTEIKIENILESEVSEKYYLDKLNKFLPENIKFNKTKNNINSILLENYTNFLSEAKLYNIDGVSPTITATGANSRVKIYINDRIRMLTPRESWKLMGFKDEQYDKIKHLHNDNELKKQAGNSIVVNVLEEIFKNLKNYF